MTRSEVVPEEESCRQGARLWSGREERARPVLKNPALSGLQILRPDVDIFHFVSNAAPEVTLV